MTTMDNKTAQRTNKKESIKCFHTECFGILPEKDIKEIVYGISCCIHSNLVYIWII